MKVISLVVTADEMNVHTEMNGIAATEGRQSICIATTAHICSQKICMRYIP
jgi:hypothetical protein